jgi:hypothetical protein
MVVDQEVAWQRCGVMQARSSQPAPCPEAFCDKQCQSFPDREDLSGEQHLSCVYDFAREDGVPRVGARELLAARANVTPHAEEAFALRLATA